MKQFKNLVALVLALTMVLSLSTAFAASITINPNVTVDQADQISTTYTYYKLLDASIATVNGTTAVSYYVENNTTNAALITALNAVTVDVSGDAKNIFTHTASSDNSRIIYSLNTADLGSVADSSEMAKKIATALDGIKSNNLGSANFSYDSTTGKAQATGLTAGYYLVTSSLGTALVLDTLDDVTINTKNEYITDTKTVSKYEYQIGEVITYKIEITVPATAKVGDKIYVHDILDTTYVGIHDSQGHITTTEADYAITAKLNSDTGDAVTLNAVPANDTNRGDNDTWCRYFEVAAGMTKVIITYPAEIMSNAATETGYSNKSWAHDSSFKTNPSEVKVYTFDIKVDKSFTGIEDDAAEDFVATFELQDANGTVIPLIEDTAATLYHVADENDAAAAKKTTFQVNGKTIANIVGLGEGTYYLEEKTTANGYNLPAKKIKVVITDTTAAADKPMARNVSFTVKYGEADVTDDNLSTATNKIIPINNAKGAELPSTGGIGTTIIYVVGAVLVLGAAAVILARRKAEQE